MLPNEPPKKQCNPTHVHIHSSVCRNKCTFPYNFCQSQGIKFLTSLSTASTYLLLQRLFPYWPLTQIIWMGRTQGSFSPYPFIFISLIITSTMRPFHKWALEQHRIEKESRIRKKLQRAPICMEWDTWHYLKINEISRKSDYSVKLSPARFAIKWFYRLEEKMNSYM